MTISIYTKLDFPGGGIGGQVCSSRPLGDELRPDISTDSGTSISGLRSGSPRGRDSHTFAYYDLQGLWKDYTGLYIGLQVQLSQDYSFANLLYLDLFKGVAFL